MKPNKEELMQFDNYEDAAYYYKVSQRTIRRWLDSYGLYEPKKGFGPGKISDGDVHKIRCLYDQGNTQAEIGKIFGISQAMVGRIVNDLSHKKGIKMSGSARVSCRYHNDPTQDH